MNLEAVPTSTPLDPTSHVDSPLSTVLYDISEQVQSGMEELLKMITEIDRQSAEVDEEIAKCKEKAFARRKSIEEEMNQFQKAAYAGLDILNIRYTNPSQSKLENVNNF